MPSSVGMRSIYFGLLTMVSMRVLAVRWFRKCHMSDCLSCWYLISFLFIAAKEILEIVFCIPVPAYAFQLWPDMQSKGFGKEVRGEFRSISPAISFRTYSQANAAIYALFRYNYNRSGRCQSGRLGSPAK